MKLNPYFIRLRALVDSAAVSQNGPAGTGTSSQFNPYLGHRQIVVEAPVNCLNEELKLSLSGSHLEGRDAPGYPV